MSIIIPKTPLLQALSSLVKIGAGASAHPEHNLVRIAAEGKKQTCKLLAFDLEQVLEFELPGVMVEEELSLAVNSKQLLSLVKADKKSADLLFKAGQETLEIHAAGALLGSLPFEAIPDCIPEAAIPKSAVNLALPSNFKTILDNAKHCVSDDPSRKALGSILLSEDGVVSTDGKELFHVQLPFEGLGKDLLLKHSSALASIKPRWQSLRVWEAEEGARRYAVTGEDFSFIAKGQSGFYPNWRSVLPDEEELDLRVRLGKRQTEELQAYLKGVHGSHDRFVELCILKDGQLSVKDQAGRQVFVQTESSGYGEDHTVSCNADYLLKALRFGHDRLLLSSRGTSPLKCDGGAGCYIFMPARREAESRGNSVENKAEATKSPSPEKPHASNESSIQEAVKNSPPAVPTTTSKNNPEDSGQSKQGENQMSKTTRRSPFVTPAPATVEEPDSNPLEEAAQHLDELKDELKALSDKVTLASRKFKEVMQEQRRQEREYNTAVKKLERIRQASGF